MKNILFFCVWLGYCIQKSTCFVSGSFPRVYRQGDPIPLKVDKLTSSKTQYPLSFYDLPYCQPETIVDEVDNIGEVLQGNLLQNSLIQFSFLKNESCRVMCVKQLKEKDARAFMEAIEDDYVAHMWLDGLPVGTVIELQQGHGENNTRADGQTHNMFPHGHKNRSDVFYLGATMGIVLDHDRLSASHVLATHWDFIVEYHRESSFKRNFLYDAFLKYVIHYESNPSEGFTITGFKVTSRSFAYPNQLQVNSKWVELPKQNSFTVDDEKDICAVPLRGESNAYFFLNKTATSLIPFTYSVTFEESPIPWQARWDRYLQLGISTHTEIHWLGLCNSVLIILCLSVVVAVVLRHTVVRDITTYNRLEDSERQVFQQDDVGWKLIHGDVFRRPTYGRWLAASAGAGVQLFGLFFSFLFLIVTGCIALEKPGSILTSLSILYPLLGVVGGYVALTVASLFEKSNGPRNLTVVYLTAMLLPGACVSVVFFMNVLPRLFTTSAYSAVFVLTKLFVLWFGVNVPLVFLGAYIAKRVGPVTVPVRTNQIPGPIPPTKWYLRPYIGPVLTGVLPFCASFTELFFIFASLWHHQYYLFFGFMLVTLILLIITSAEISITFTYLLLSAEDYRWWWPSFWVSGFSGVYFFFYSILYYYTKLYITSLSGMILYFSYSLLLAMTFTLLTGSAGFLASFYFVKKIYSAVKID